MPVTLVPLRSVLAHPFWDCGQGAAPFDAQRTGRDTASVLISPSGDTAKPNALAEYGKPNLTIYDSLGRVSEIFHKALRAYR